jgi:glycosyltransferase involved in cell wall biosynthesis
LTEEAFSSEIRWFPEMKGNNGWEIKKGGKSVAIVAFPWKSRAPYLFLSEIIEILEPITDRIVLICGNKDNLLTIPDVKICDVGIGMHYVVDIRPTWYSAIIWILKCALVQVKESLELLKSRKSIDIVIFYMAYPYFLLPLITAKLINKKTIEVITRNYRPEFVSRLIRFQDPLLYSLLDGISPESNRIISDLGLERYKEKLLPEGARYIDTSSYRILTDLRDRQITIGYIGRLSKGKGIMEFLEAIRQLTKNRDDIDFLIGGNGELSDDVEKYIREEKLGDLVRRTGWISKELLPEYLNSLKLIVLPTKGEGLPTIVLEAMACGTPVLTTSAGAIPDVIIDEETGFLMENNSPDCIVENIIRVLDYHEPVRIVTNARVLVEQRFTYNAAVNRWKKMLNEVQ